METETELGGVFFPHADGCIRMFSIHDQGGLGQDAILMGFKNAPVNAIRKSKIAVFLGLLLFGAQFVLNTFAHILSGVFRFH